MRICNGDKVQPVLVTPVPGNIYRYKETGSFYICNTHNTLISLTSGAGWNTNNGFGVHGAEGFTDVTDKVCLDVSQLED